MDKSLFFQTGQIKGKPREGYFTFFFQHVPTEENLKELRGTLFTLVEIKGQTKEKAEASANQAFGSARTAFYQATGNNLKALEEALSAFEAATKQQGLEAEITATVLWGSVSYIGKVGAGGVILVREGEAKKIDFTKVASGALSDKDNLFLLDSQAYKNVDFGQIPPLLREDFEESLKNVGQSMRDKVGGGLSIRLTIQEPIEKAEQILVADLDRDIKALDKTRAIGAKKDLLGFLKPLTVLVKEKFAAASPGLKKLSTQTSEAGKKYLEKSVEWVVFPWKPKKPGEVGGEEEKKRRRVVQTASLLAVILIASIVIGVFNHQRNQETGRVQEGITFVKDSFAEAEKLKAINPAKAANLVLEAEEKLNALPEDNSEVIELRTRLEELLAQINKIYKAKPQEFADLTLVKGNIQSKVLRLAGSSIYVLDAGTGSVIKVGLKGGDPLVFVAEKLGLQSMAVTDQFLYLQLDNGVKRIDLSNKQETDVAGSSSSWKKLISAQSFSENLYLLDSEAGQIWKYVPAGSGISGPQNYFPVRFEEKPTAFAIDSAIYVTSQKDVFKFVAGQKSDFQIKNLPRAFGKIADLFTNKASKNLFVLDKEAGSVVVIDKGSGQYQGLYEDGKLKEASSIVADEPGKKVYFLVGNTIFSFGIK